MNYFQGRRKKANQKPILIIFLIIALFGILFFFSGQDSASRYFNFSPFLKVKESIGGFFTDRQYFMQSKEKLMSENRQLRQQVESLESARLVNRALVQENIYLKEVFNRTDDTRLVLANIVTSPKASIYDTFMIDAGQSDGLEVGDLVLAHGDVVIGEIIEVNSSRSKVLLASSSGHITNVRLEELDILTEATGRGGGNFQLTLPRDLDVQKDQLVTMPSGDNLIIATVGEIVSDAREPSQRVLLTSPINANQLKWVQVKID